MRIPLLLLVLTFGPEAISAAPPKVSQEDATFFETRIRPLLVRRCFDCHGPDTENEAGLKLDSLGAMLGGGRSGREQRQDKPAQHDVRPEL